MPRDYLAIHLFPGHLMSDQVQQGLLKRAEVYSEVPVNANVYLCFPDRIRVIKKKDLNILKKSLLTHDVNPYLIAIHVSTDFGITQAMLDGVDDEETRKELDPFTIDNDVLMKNCYGIIEGHHRVQALQDLYRADPKWTYKIIIGAHSYKFPRTTAGQTLKLAFAAICNTMKAQVVANTFLDKLTHISRLLLCDPVSKNWIDDLCATYVSRGKKKAALSTARKWISVTQNMCHEGLQFMLKDEGTPESLACCRSLWIENVLFHKVPRLLLHNMPFYTAIMLQYVQLALFNNSEQRAMHDRIQFALFKRFKQWFLQAGLRTGMRQTILNRLKPTIVTLLYVESLRGLTDKFNDIGSEEFCTSLLETYESSKHDGSLVYTLDCFVYYACSWQ